MGGIAIDGAGNLYIADAFNNKVRKVTATTGIISTAIGSSISFPEGLAADGAGNVYVADQGNHVTKLTVATGALTVVAGNGTGGYSGDNGAATSAELNVPGGLALDGAGNLYIVDEFNNRIRKVTAATGVITTVAGNGTGGFSGDGGAATGAELSDPYGVAVDSAGDLYIGDQGNSRVREVTAAGTIGTVAGYGYITNYSTGQDGGSATSAKFFAADLIALDGAGNLYFADGGDNRILKVTAAAVALNFASTAVGATSTDSPQTVTLNNIGNMALTFPAPGSVGSLNPSLSAGFVCGGSSTCNQIGSTSGGFTLASGSTCTEIVSFVPVAGGTVAGSVTSEDNSLNATSTQAVALNGTGIQLAPTVTAISPAAGPGAGGTLVTITGTNFTGATGVRFGAFASPSFTANSSTSITAIAPANTTGTVDVMVTTAAGTSATSAADQFTYLAAIVAVQSESAIGGSTPTLSATVTFVAGYAPSGAVTFQAGSGSPVTATCTATTSSTETCTAAYPTTGLLNGANTITATLAADSNYNTASGTGTLTTVAASFTAPTEAVGTASPTQTATLVFNTATTLNSTLATAVQVVTQGLTGYDFNYASGSTGTACTPGGSYAAGASCTVTYSFTPKAPGVRQGAILLSSNASTPAVVAAAFLSGTGTGPLAQVTPGLLSTLAGTGAACTGTAPAAMAARRRPRC